MKSIANSKLYLIFIVFLALSLLVINGIDIPYRIDNYTVIFFSFLCIPLVTEIIESIKNNLKVKAGNIEVNFNELTLKDQIFVFLNGIIFHHQWTFYDTRDEETKLGKAFYILISEYLIKEFNEEFHQQIKKWFKSENDNVIWFASEVVGYFQISEFKPQLRKKINKINPKKSLSTAKLNCLWAHSRFDDYKSLIDFFENTNSSKNQKWIIHVFHQMPKKKHADAADFIPVLENFITRQNLEQDVINSAKKTLESLRKKANS